MSLETATEGGAAATPQRQQRRGRRIAMTPAEIDAFLAEERTCRVSTVGADGAPHTSALWFVWDGSALWLNSIVKSQRWTDLNRARGCRCSSTPATASASCAASS